MDPHYKHLISLLDLTLLDPTAELPDLEKLCRKAATPLGNVAAVCVYPEWVALCKDLLTPQKIRVAAVANFPAGNAALHTIETELDQILRCGADEIDFVFPYHQFLQGEILACEAALEMARTKSHNRVLKVILETGAFTNLHALEKACELVLDFSPDYLKTSTGKIFIGATPEAFQVMLNEIQKKGVTCGVKVSGGIHTVAQADVYFALAEKMWGESSLHAEVFRIGASRLLDALCPSK